MSTQTTLNAPPPSRKGRQPILNPAQAGLPDPRPVTDYTAVHTVVGGKSRLTITLNQPCVIRTPLWPVIDCATGNLITPGIVTVTSNTSFYFDFGALLANSVAFVQAPYQDTQVQNFQGGFVRPGGQWFRAPT